MSLQAEFQRENHEPETKDVFSFHKCHGLWVTGMDFSLGCDLNSQPQYFHWGEVFRDLGPSLCVLKHTARDSSHCDSRRRISNALPKKQVCTYSSIQDYTPTMHWCKKETKIAVICQVIYNKQQWRCKQILNHFKFLDNDLVDYSVSE